MAISATGIVLRKRPIFESKLQVMLFSPTLGRTYILSRQKNSKKDPFLGHIDPPNIIDIMLTKGKSMTYLNSANLRQAFPTIRTSFNKISLSAYLISLTIQFTRPDQPNPELYDALKNALETLNTTDELNTIQTHFERQLLYTEGIHPNTTLSDDKCRELLCEYSQKPIQTPQYLT